MRWTELFDIGFWEKLEAISSYADLLGFFSIFISIGMWAWLLMKNNFNETRIEIILVADDNQASITLPCKIERKHFTRSEVQGLIGILPTQDQKRYQISYLREPEFFERLASVQDKRRHTILKIKCTNKEMEQFRLKPPSKKITLYWRE